jgi:hypothetical protein
VDRFVRAKVEQIVLSNQGDVVLAPIVLQWEGIEQSGLIRIPIRRRALADVTERAVAIRLAGEDGDLPMAGAKGELWLDHARVGVCLTDGDGFCRFTGLKGGSYWFRAKHEG